MPTHLMIQKNYRKMLVVLGVVFCCHVQAQVKVVKLADLQQLLTAKQDTTYIINFWATWCSPCIEELPYFEEINRKTADRNVKVYLVSLDEIEGLDHKVVSFIKKKNLQSEVWLLDEHDANVWMNQIDTSWSGAIPATLVVNTFRRKRIFVDESVTLQVLEAMIAK
ncbi:MAG: TlpA family protein disulfide reductase [Verrucomicrobia bacterium]|nr:TlpA family protein disulfide reductase [Cytophagales bacterium]